jgi:invasion protein IalB
MTALFRTSALALILAAAGLAATAQEATDGAEAPATEAPAADAPANSEGAGALSMGSSTEPQVGQLYVKGEFGDWDLRCVRTESGNDPCQLYQLLNDAEGNSVAEVSLFDLRDQGPAAAGATIITPLETLLTEQLRLGIDAAAPKAYPFSFCSQVGCFSRLGFTAEEVDALRAGSSAKITIVPAAAPGQVVELTMSLSGFTAGFEAVVEANAAQAAQQPAPANE